MPIEQAELVERTDGRRHDRRRHSGLRGDLAQRSVGGEREQQRQRLRLDLPDEADAGRERQGHVGDRVPAVVDQRLVEAVALDEPEAAVEEIGIAAERREPVEGREQALDVLAAGAEGGLRSGVPPNAARAFSAAEDHRAEADFDDALAFVVVQPAADGGPVARGFGADRLVPARRVLERIDRAVREDERVALEPLRPFRRALPALLRVLQIQLQSTVANPPGRRWAAAPRTTSRQIASPGSPLSRKTNSLSGEITNGGLATIRSKVSPSTGSNRLPSLRSSERPFNRDPSAAYSSARRLTSVATTVRACRAASSACTPEPVPISSARSTGRRTVRVASVREAALTPVTTSASDVPDRGRSAFPRRASTRTRGQMVSPSSSARPAPASASARTGSDSRATRSPRTKRPQERCARVVRAVPVEDERDVVAARRRAQELGEGDLVQPGRSQLPPERFHAGIVRSRPLHERRRYTLRGKTRRPPRARPSCSRCGLRVIRTASRPIFAYPCG